MDQIKARILIVDDDETILFLFSKALERNNQYEIVTALDGVQAMQIMESSLPFAVVLTDMMMPIMSGLDLAYKARQIDPYVQVVMVTAASSVEIAIAAMRDAQVWDYLLKPLPSLSHLNVVVERAVAHHRLVIEQDHGAGQLSALVAHVRDGVLVASAEGHIRIANPAVEALLERTDIVNCRVQEILPPHLLNLVKDWLKYRAEDAPCLEAECGGARPWKVFLASMPAPQPGSGDWVLTIQAAS
jgi:CheY-like chemotaxis protein